MKKKEKFKYITDTESGIRTITQIEKLPVKELNDEEICKLFFKRFDAEALIMVYQDKSGQMSSFGRLRRGQRVFAAYRMLCSILNNVWGVMRNSWRSFDPEDLE